MEKAKKIFSFIFLISNLIGSAQIETLLPTSNGIITPNSSANATNGTAEIDRIISIVNQVETSNNFIGQINPDSLAPLPFGIIKQIGAARYIIAIDSMKFKPQGAYFSAYAAIDFPGTLKKIAFKGSNIKFNPSGVIGGEQARLHLASEHIISINSTVSLKLSANQQNWVEWDCNGFKAINLVGHFVFKKGKLIPDPTQTTDSVVSASFQIYTQNIHEFITTVNITPFKLAGLPDWSFKVTDAVVDMSELENAPSFTFPQGYPVENLLSPESWTGFALKSLFVKLPRELSETGKKTELVVNNLQIDHMGLSGLFQVNNLFGTNQGSMNGWAFSIDELGVGFIANHISSGQIKGKVEIPVLDSTQALQYTAGINHNNNTGTTNYNFILNPASNLNFKVFNANVSLNNNSTLGVTVQNGNFKPVANFSGLISFSNPKFNSNGSSLAFQNLTIITEAPYITNGVFSLNNIGSAQSSLNHFPLTLNEISVGVNQGAPVLGFSVTLNLSNESTNPIGVGTSLLIKGKFEGSQQTYSGEYPVTHTRQKFGFDKVIINGISLNYQTGPCTFQGLVLYKDDDPQYGNGFFGSIQMSIPGVSAAQINASACFGSLPAYKYFYVDAKVTTDISLGQIPIKITRLIGGLYYHMAPNKSSEEEFIDLNKNFVPTSSNALQYTPDQTHSAGLKAGVSYQCSLNERPYNGDVLFEINFTSSGGLGTVNLNGDIYSLTSVNNKASAPVKGKIGMQFDAPNKTFDAMAQVVINCYQVITGTGYFKLHIDPQTWYACVGKPTAPCNIALGTFANIPFYCMVGNSIEPPAAPPAAIAAIPNISAFYGNRNISQMQAAGGFCAGGKISSHLSRTFGLSFFNVTGAFDFDLGFDMMLTDYGPNAHCQGSTNKIGINGSLANGSMYLAMSGGVSINGSFKFPNDCPHSYESHLFCGKHHCCCQSVTLPCLVNGNFSYNVFSAGVAAVVAAKGPNPYYFAGDVNCHYNIFDKVTGDFNFDFSYGEDCTPIPN
ncbi:MAG: hypothetical protein H0W61_12520 [Bacteroidetes bacterium]|nr:hypothetical protein [Bacteroidota bacterium]